MHKAPHLLQNDCWQVGILPDTGASIAFGRIYRDGTWLNFMRPTAEADYGNSSLCASFLMIPWCNRVRDHRFRFDGVDYLLEANSPDGMASHGVGRDYPWTITAASDQYIALHFASSDHQAVNFPFRFSAAVEYRLDGPDFVLNLTLKNDDQRPMPGGFGHHTYFVRSLGTPQNDVQIEIPCTEQYVLENKLPSEPPVPITQRLDFRSLRPLKSEVYPGEIDDILTSRQGDMTARFMYRQTNTEIIYDADPIFKHAVLYAPEGKTFFAVEPVTNVTDGFNLYDRGMSGTGVFILQPGETATSTARLKVVKA